MRFSPGTCCPCCRWGLSLYLTVRELGIRLTPWSDHNIHFLTTALPIYTLLLICNPLHQHLLQGQINLVLLVLIVGVWWADRTGRPVWAGSSWARRRRSSSIPGFCFCTLSSSAAGAVAAGAASIIVLTLLTAAVLGTESYRDYIVDVMPTLGGWRSSWPNVSLLGFWSKLFDPDSNAGMTIPLVHSPLLARAGTAISCALVVAAVVFVVRRARSQSERDHAFAICITAMLLVTPIVWDHYFVLLLQ